MATMSLDDLKEQGIAALRSIPDLARLLLGLLRDPRVPRRPKLVFGAALAYLVLPVDFVPDWLPGLGPIDDLLVGALALDAILNHVPDVVVAEHWRGDAESLGKIKGLVATAGGFLPEGVKGRLLSSE